MNLFCFTLDGSTESVYEPAYSQTLKEVQSKHPCSPLLRRKPEWASSDPAINRNQLQSPVRLKEIHRRSCAASASLDVEALGHMGDPSSPSQKPRETREAPCQSEILIQERSKTEPHCRGSPHSSTRLMKFVQARKVRHRGAAKVEKRRTHDVSDNNPVLTCIGLGRHSEIESSSSDLEEKHQVPENPLGPVDVWDWSERLWSPLDCTQAQTPLSHACHLPPHELRILSGDLTLPRATEWDRFQRMITERDQNPSDQSAPQMIRSITDLHGFQNTLTRFGRFDAPRQHSSMTPRDNGGALEQSAEPSAPRSEAAAPAPAERRPVEATPEKALTAVTHEGEKREDDSGRPLMKTHLPSCKSLESLYSGQSSSSGVTSGCSSNRDSLRLEDEPLSSRPFCGRARVHTDFVPSPYDTESLKLTVGDVIDIISKPPMGIWTGVLNNKVGNFKFIYVDVLADSSPEGFRAARLTHKCKSTVHEVLKRLSLEDYSTSLQLSGFQTVDDLMRLREHHLTELDVTDPEHRRRLLAAVHSLQQLCCERRTTPESDVSVRGSADDL